MNSPKTPVKLAMNQTDTEFYNHLNDSSNSRILFTAPFGSGKSTFLRDFFSRPGVKFVNINLYPVNYAVAGNEDIFDLIKFDILSELLGRFREKLPTLKKESFELALQAQVFALHSDNGPSFIKSLVSASSKIGKSAVDILVAVEKLQIDFKKFRDRAENNNEVTIRTFIEELGTKPLIEMDDVSFIISECLNDLRLSDFSSDQDRRSDVILVIDDLDRLDPEHIFRLFNVFSAHYDSVTERNKFGFDKVIFVCDIENIHKMYEHRYGENVDFNGYMDKFYSTLPFQFDSRIYLVERLADFLEAKAWKIEESVARFLSSYGLKNIVKFALLALINSKKITLRMLDHSPIYTVSSLKPLNLGNPAFRYSHAAFFPFYLLIDYLGTLYSHFGKLENALQSLANSYGPDFVPPGMDLYSMDKITHNIIEACLPFILPVEEVFTQEHITNPKGVNECPGQSGCFFHYTLHPERGMHSYNRVPHLNKVTLSKDDDSPLTKTNVYQLIYTTLMSCKDRGIF